ncbi:hypothetical protein ACOMHN_042471 [Nucella lapillus]
MVTGKESEVIHGIEQKDDCEIFLLKAAEPSLPTFASTAVCQDTAKATDPTPADGVNIILTNVSHSEDHGGPGTESCRLASPSPSPIPPAHGTSLKGNVGLKPRER